MLPFLFRPRYSIKDCLQKLLKVVVSIPCRNVNPLKYTWVHLILLEVFSHPCGCFDMSNINMIIKVKTKLKCLFREVLHPPPLLPAPTRPGREPNIIHFWYSSQWVIFKISKCRCCLFPIFIILNIYWKWSFFFYPPSIHALSLARWFIKLSFVFI